MGKSRAHKSEQVNTTPSQRKSFHDQPISNKDEDRLGVLPFAEQLAKRLAQWPYEEPVVIGLYGGWGDGKSSIKNLVLSQLDTSRFLVVPFEPWLYAGGESQLHHMFFRELSLAIHESSAKNEDLAEGVANFGAAIKGASKMVPLIIKAKFGEEVAELTEGALESIHFVSDRESEILKDPKPLPKRRELLVEKLKKFKKRILVVIDDIDRLDSKEMAEVFQLVKAHANFPNVTYLLLFEPTLVQESLNDVTHNRGREYLEKIVQVGIHLPKIELSRLHRYLIEQLEELTSVNVTQNPRWEKAFKDVIGPWFTNMRKVHRFLNSVSFHLDIFQFAPGSSSEINLIDLLILEVLRVFESNVFALIHKNADIFAPNPVILGMMLASRYDKHEFKDKAKALKESIQDLDKTERCLKAVKLIFPDWARIIADKGVSILTEDVERINEKQMYQDSRICHHRLIHKYFQLATPTNDISRREIDEWFNVASDFKAFADRFIEFAKTGRGTVALDYLDNLIKILNENELVPVMAALFSLSERTYGTERGELYSIYSVFECILKRFENSTDRETAVESAMNKVPTCICSPLFLIRHSKILARSKKIVKLCTERAQSLSAHPDFIARPQLYEIIGNWNQFDPTRAKTCVEKIILTAGGVAALLSTALNIGNASEWEGETAPALISLEGLGRLVDIQTLSDRVESFDFDLVSPPLTEHQMLAVNCFKAADDLRKAGKPTDDDSLWIAHVDEKIERIHRDPELD